jgi:hypothetical protein
MFGSQLEIDAVVELSVMSPAAPSQSPHQCRRRTDDDIQVGPAADFVDVRGSVARTV